MFFYISDTSRRTRPRVLSDENVAPSGSLLNVLIHASPSLPDITTVYPVGCNAWVNYFGSPRPGKILEWVQQTEQVSLCKVQIFKEAGNPRYLNRRLYIEVDHVVVMNSNELLRVMRPFKKVIETRDGKVCTLANKDLQFLAENMTCL